MRDPAKKATIRKIVEAEEKINYDKRMKKSWVDDLSGIMSDPRFVADVNRAQPDRAWNVMIERQTSGRIYWGAD